MEFKDTKTDEIITLEEIKEWYIRKKQEGNLMYINFQDYLTDCIYKYGIIEVIWNGEK